MGRLIILVILSIGMIQSASGDENTSPYLDMTYSYNADTLSWPGFNAFNQTIFLRGADNQFGLYMEANDFCVSEHAGTQIDAPAHFIQGRARLGAVPLDNLIGPGVKIDIKAKADADIDALLSVEDLEAWEEDNGPIPDGAVVFMYTGWGTKYPNKDIFWNIDANGTLHFPGISGAAAQWLVDNRKIIAVGTECASLDAGNNGGAFPGHLTLLAQDIVSLEYVANMDKLPAKGFTVFAIPMKIEEGSGGPVRIFATGWNPDIPDPFRLAGCSHVNPPPPKP